MGLDHYPLTASAEKEDPDMVTKRARRRRPGEGELTPDQWEQLSTMLGITHDQKQISTRLQQTDAATLSMVNSPDEIPEPERLFDGLVVDQQRLLVSAREKALKTTLKLHVDVCLASGQALFGKFKCLSPGPVIYWSGEGGRNYILDRVDRICSVYGINRKSLNMETVSMAVPMDYPTLLYKVGEQLVRWGGGFPADDGPRDGRVRSVTLDPLYLYAPSTWDQKTLITFDGALSFSNLCERFGATPAIVHHNSRGGRDGLQKAAGAGPAEWAGQWLLIDRTEPWRGEGHPHHLTIEFGGRGIGGNRWSLEVDDKTLEVEVTEFDPEYDQPSRKLATVDKVRKVIAMPWDANHQELTTDELCEELSVQIEVGWGDEIQSHSLSRYLPQMVTEEHIHIVRRASGGNVYAVGPAPI